MRISRVSQCCGTRGSLSSVDFQPHAKPRTVHRIATAAGTEVQIWALWRDDAGTKKSALKCVCLYTFREHSPYEVATARWSPNGRYLASTDSGGTTHILERSDEKCRQLEHSLGCHEPAGNADAASPAPEPEAEATTTKVTRKFTFKYDGTTAKRQRQTGMPNRTKAGRTRISYDSQSVKTEVVKPVTVESNGGNFEAWKSIQSFRCPSRMGQLFDISWAPDNRSIVGGGLNGQVAVFDIFTKQVVAHFDVFEGQIADSIAHSRGYVKSVAWDPMTLYIAVQTSGREASVWRRSPPNPEGSAQKWNFKRVFHDTDLFQKSQCDVLGGSRISWAPNGQVVAFPSAGKATLNFAACFEVVHADLSRDIAVLRDGKPDHRRLQLAYDTADHNVRQDAMLLHGHPARVRNVRFSQDLMVPQKRGLCKGATSSDSDRFIFYAQSSDDGTISIWRFKHASNWDSQYKNEVQCICVIQNASDEQSSLEDLAWGNGGRWLAVATSQGGIILVELGEEDTSTRFHSNWMDGLKIEDAHEVTTDFLNKVEQYQSKKTPQGSSESSAKEQSGSSSDGKSATSRRSVGDVAAATATAGSVAWAAASDVHRYAAQYHPASGGTPYELVSAPFALKDHIHGVGEVAERQLMHCVTAVLLSTLVKALHGIAEACVAATAMLICHVYRTLPISAVPALCRSAAGSNSRVLQADVDIASRPSRFGQGAGLAAIAIRGIQAERVGTVDSMRLYDPDSAEPCLEELEFGRHYLGSTEYGSLLPPLTNGFVGPGNVSSSYPGGNMAALHAQLKSGTVESAVTNAVKETSPSRRDTSASRQSDKAGKARETTLDTDIVSSPTSKTGGNKRDASERSGSSPRGRGRPPSRRPKTSPVTEDRITDIWLSMEYPQDDDLAELLKCIDKTVPAVDPKPQKASEQEPVTPAEPETSQNAVHTDKRGHFESAVSDVAKEVEETSIETATAKATKGRKTPPISTAEKETPAHQGSPQFFILQEAVPHQKSSSLKPSPGGLQYHVSSSRNSAINSPLLTGGMGYLSSIAGSDLASPLLTMAPPMSPIWAGSLDSSTNIQATFGPLVDGPQHKAGVRAHLRTVPAPPPLQLDQSKPPPRLEGLFEVPLIRPSLSVQIQGANKQVVVINRANTMCSALVACVERNGDGTLRMQWTKQVSKGYATHICPVQSEGMVLIVTQICRKSIQRDTHDPAECLNARGSPVGGGKAVDLGPAKRNAKLSFTTFFTLMDTLTGATLIDGCPISNVNVARINVFPCGNRIYAAFTATKGGIALYIFYRKLGCIAWTVSPNIVISANDFLKSGTCADIKQLQMLCVNLNAAQSSAPKNTALGFLTTKEKQEAESDNNEGTEAQQMGVATAPNDGDRKGNHRSKMRRVVTGKERDTTFVAILVYMQEPQVYVLTQYYEPFLIDLTQVHRLFRPQKPAANVMSFGSLCDTYRCELGLIQGADVGGDALFNDVVHRLVDVFHLDPTLKDHYPSAKTEKSVEDVVVEAALQRDRLLAAMLVLGSRSEYILQLHEHVHDMVARIQAAKLCDIVAQLYKRSIEWCANGWRGPRVELTGFDARLMNVIGVDVSAILHEFLLPLLWDLYVALEEECKARGMEPVENRPDPVPAPQCPGRCHKYCTAASARCPISRARKAIGNTDTTSDDELKPLREVSVLCCVMCSVLQVCAAGLHNAAAWERALSCAQATFTP
ncbi:hypothetical protein, conserved [Babesia bigemina]|uniref:WD domain, G-beta repeat containing protein n=1 Tax=Babesia bigemina TaxID=5866 RepID=A0A061D8E5_BABBI|nr:hypothetical protein, conserved [Babesia bigemina]CDR96971.1 hypothetical protein, conserved [Babesia bigemina]|eukprot:XP_012769157.1 hypothetical protein, conserved [Babesia bigemina]